MVNRIKSENDFHIDDLTWRERDILNLLAERLSNREIAERLYLAESLVKDYVGKILSKIHVKNRRQAVELAKELGILGAGIVSGILQTTSGMMVLATSRERLSPKSETILEGTRSGTGFMQPERNTLRAVCKYQGR